jgi:hypothetical protein
MRRRGGVLGVGQLAISAIAAISFRASAISMTPHARPQDSEGIGKGGHGMRRHGGAAISIPISTAGKAAAGRVVRSSFCLSALGREAACRRDDDGLLLV